MGYRNKKGMTIPAGIGLGAAMSLLVTLIGAAVVAYLVLRERVGESGIGVASMVVVLIGSIMGAWSAYRFVQKQRLQICLMSGAAYYLLLLGMTALFFGGQYRSMGTTAIIVLAGAMFVSFFPKAGGKISFKKRLYR